MLEKLKRIYKLGEVKRTVEVKETKEKNSKDFYISIGIITAIIGFVLMAPKINESYYSNAKPKQSISKEYYDKVIGQRKAEIQREKESEIRVLKKGIEMLEEERAKIAVMKELLKESE